VSVRRDAARNHQRVLAAAREVLGEYGAEAAIEQIAARAGVGIGTVYRHFTNKDALIDELLRLALEDIIMATEQAMARNDGHGLEQLLGAIGRSFAQHARYADLLLARHTDEAAARHIRAALEQLTARARAAGTMDPDVTFGDVMVLVWALRGLVQTTGTVAPACWQRFLAIHLAGLRSSGQPAGAFSLTPRQLSRLAPRRASSRSSA
jgi:AcrR family transcriptional regulator